MSHKLWVKKLLRTGQNIPWTVLFIKLAKTYFCEGFGVLAIRLDLKHNPSPGNGISYDTRSGLLLDWSSTASGVVLYILAAF